MEQLQIDFSKRAKLRGIKKAEDHANQVHPDWSQKAFNFLLQFISTCNDDFMVEEVRKASEHVVPKAPTSRAWGAIILKAVKARLVKKVGIRSVKNSNAHMANAAVWRKV